MTKQILPDNEYIKEKLFNNKKEIIEKRKLLNTGIDSETDSNTIQIEDKELYQYILNIYNETKNSIKSADMLNMELNSIHKKGVVDIGLILPNKPVEKPYVILRKSTIKLHTIIYYFILIFNIETVPTYVCIEEYKTNDEKQVYYIKNLHMLYRGYVLLHKVYL